MTVSGVQVSFRTPVSRQSFTVEVCVIDKNDNVPAFIGQSMRGSVQLGLLKGKRTLSCGVPEVQSYADKKRNPSAVRGEIVPMNSAKRNLLLMSTSNHKHLRAQNDLFWEAQQGMFQIVSHFNLHFWFSDG